ncbi:MAG: VCBS repeat-containing protein [Planctomycetota bacterium]
MHINPEESGPYYDLGHLALLCGESDRARSDLELAVRRNPKGFQASADLAWLARSNGDLKGAAALYLRAIEQCRGDLPIAGVLGEGDTEATKQRFHPESDRSIAIFAGLVRTSLEIGSYAEQVPAPLRLPHGFTLETPASGAWFAPPVDVHGAGGGAVAVDIDHDGDLDIVLAGWHDGATLLEHDGARWREAALVVQGGSAPRAWDVIRLSGDEQPLLLYFVSGGWGGRENRLLRARGDATFEDVTAAAGLAGARATMCACAVDVNGDRELDLVEGLATRHDAVRVWLRHADRFEAASNAAIDGPITHLAAHGASVLAARGRAGLALLAIDPSGSVRDEARTRGLTGASGWVAAWVDIDGDGCDDVFAPGMPSYEQALRNWLRLPAEAPRVVFYRGSREGTFSAANDALLQLGSVVDVAVLQNGRRSALYLACGGLRLDHEEMDVVLCMAADGKVALHAPWAPEHLPGKTVHVLAAELTGDQLPDLYLARSGFYPSDRRADRILRGLAHGETAQR